jgi:ABC-type phosphate/phosphonate transport system substrate-binding protein
MLRNIIACVAVFLALNSTASPIKYGIIAYSHSTSLLGGLRKAEVAAMQKIFHQPIEFHPFTTSTEVLSCLQNNPKALSLIYATATLSAKLQRLGNWRKIAQQLEYDSTANILSSTYSSYLITSKKSNIKQLPDLVNKKIAFFNNESTSNFEVIKRLLEERGITSIQWVQAKDLDEVLSLVATGNADAAGVWGYYFAHSKEKGKLKVLYKIKGLENPSLYGNTDVLSTDDIININSALKQEGANKHLAFSYN